MAKTKYPGVTILTDNPGDYTMYKDAVVVPHGRPEKGQNLEDSNYYEFTADKNINDIMRSVGLPAGEIIMGPKKNTEEQQEYEEPAPKKRGRKAKVYQKQDTVQLKPAADVEWEIPSVGTLKSTYSYVDVGDECVALYVSPGDLPFLPSDYRNHNHAVYIMKYKGSSYRVIYGGLKYKHDNYNVYILLGSRYDG